MKRCAWSGVAHEGSTLLEQELGKFSVMLFSRTICQLLPLQKKKNNQQTKKPPPNHNSNCIVGTCWYYEIGRQNTSDWSEAVRPMLM